MLVAFVAALGTAFIGSAIYLRVAPRRALDIPNARSSHSRPTPRGGGVAIVLGFLVGLGLWWVQTAGLSPRALGWLVGAVLIALVGFVDDLRSLAALPRLIAQLIAAVALTLLGVQLHDASPVTLLALPVAFTYIVGLTNIYNFMDGIDGLATTQAAIAGVALGLSGGILGNPLLEVSGSVIAAAAIGFLPFNRPRARLFMGDVGSTFLGFSFAGLTLLASIGVGGGRLPLIVGPVLLAPFVFDGTFTLIGRMLRREPWYSAHRSHLYQRLVGLGWSHGQVTSLYAGGALVSAAAALGCVLAQDVAVQVGLAGVGFAPMLGVLVLVRRAEAKRAARPTQPHDTSPVVTQGHS